MPDGTFGLMGLDPKERYTLCLWWDDHHFTTLEGVSMNKPVEWRVTPVEAAYP